MANPNAAQRRQELEQEDRIEQEETAARHRPDERAPNDPAGPPGSGGGSVHAAGAWAGGTSVGGLGGTNIGEGENDNADIDEAAGSGQFDVAVDADDEQAYGGPTGGAVGGTPAGKRARGGRVGRGLTPSEDHDDI